MRAIITVIGKDSKGIIAGVSTLLTESNINILDISQTIMSEYFTMIMLIDLAEMNVTYDALETTIEKKSEELGVKIRMQHEDIFNAMHKI